MTKQQILDELERLRFAYSNTVDPINVIHLHGLIMECEAELNAIEEEEEARNQQEIRRENTIDKHKDIQDGI
jgi:hypothetical protein